ncbi:MAG: pilus assembly protein PilM [Candidatus Brocadiia bacterium]
MASTFTGMDIGNANLKIAAIRRDGKRFIIETLQSEKLGNLGVRRGNEFNTSGISAIIKRIHTSARIGTRKTVLGLGGKEVIFRYIEVPPVGDAQIRKLLEYEQAESTKTISEQTLTDFQMLTLPRANTPTGTALVGTARQSDLDEDARLIGAAGLTLTGIIPKSLALHRLLADSGSVLESETVMLIDVGAESSEIIITQGPSLLLARSAQVGGKAFTESVARSFSVIPEVAEEIKLAEGSIVVDGKRPTRVSEFREGFDELIASEGIKFRNDVHYMTNLSRALASAAEQLRLASDSAIRYAMVQTKMKNLKVDRILLSGAGAKLPGLIEYISTAFKVPAQYWDVLSFFEASIVPLDKRDVPTEFSTALALAYCSSLRQGTVINLIPPIIKAKARFWDTEIFAYAGAVLAVAGVLFWAWGTAYEANQAGALAVSANKSLTLARGKATDLAVSLDRINLNRSRFSFIAKETFYDPVVVRFITALQDLTPDSMVISDITFESFTDAAAVATVRPAPQWRFTVRGFVSKDISELQQPDLVRLLADRVRDLPFVFNYVVDAQEAGRVVRKTKGALAPDIGSYKFLLYFYVSENGEMKYNEIAK